jgi:hypothetical protein
MSCRSTARQLKTRSLFMGRGQTAACTGTAADSQLWGVCFSTSRTPDARSATCINNLECTGRTITRLLLAWQRPSSSIFSTSTEYRYRYCSVQFLVGISRSWCSQCRDFCLRLLYVMWPRWRQGVRTRQIIPSTLSVRAQVPSRYRD